MIMNRSDESKAAIAVVRRAVEEVQRRGDFDVYEDLYADDFVDHTPQQGFGSDKAGVRELYRTLRATFSDFNPVIHWQAAEGSLVTTYKIYHGTHTGDFFGIAPTGREVHFEVVDAMRVTNGQIVEHWGVGNLLSVVSQIGGLSAVGE
jgi:predicted ester cyclase